LLALAKWSERKTVAGETKERHFMDSEEKNTLQQKENKKDDPDTTLVSALRILARDIDSEDGIANAAIAEAADRIEELAKEIKQIHKDYGCEVRDPCGTIWQHAAKVQAERDKYKSAVERLRGLLLEVLEDDTLSGGLSVLDGEMRQRISDSLS
jgi:hypothetical protein